MKIDLSFREYLESRGLTVKVLGQKMGKSRQEICAWGNPYNPTAKTLKKIATAMTELGAHTTVVDLVQIFYVK